MSARNVAEHPTVPAHAERSPRSGVWTLRVHCPWCGALHAHGGGSGDETSYGLRVPHCLTGSPPDYCLVPGPPAMENPRKGRRA